MLLALTVLCVLAGRASAAAPPVDATVTVIHGLPHFTADIYVNDKLLLDGFKPTQEAGPLHVAPGVYHVAIRNVGSSASSKPVLAGAVRLDAGGNYSIVAHLDQHGQPALSSYRNPDSPIPPGKGQVVVRAVATLPPVTLEGNGSPLVSDVAPGEQGSALVAPGRYSVAVVATGKSGPVVPPEDVNVREGSGYVFYVIGSGKDDSVGLMVEPLGTRASSPTSVQSGTGGMAAGGDSASVAVVLIVGVGLLGAGVFQARRRWRRGRCAAV
jgi:hypothetical protein